MYCLRESMNTSFCDYHSGNINIHVSSFNCKVEVGIHNLANKECWFPHYRYEEEIYIETIGIFFKLIIQHVEQDQNIQWVIVLKNKLSQHEKLYHA